MKTLTLLVLIATVSVFAIADPNGQKPTPQQQSREYGYNLNTPAPILTTEQVAQINAAQIDFLTSQATLNSGVCQQANVLFQASQAKFKALQSSFCGDGILENAGSQSQWQCKPKATQSNVPAQPPAK
jgi:hypothetical protein